MPVNLNLLSDDLIAKGVPTTSAIGDLPQNYWAGQKAGSEFEQRNLFRSGLPRDAAGNVDWNKAGQMVIESAGAPGITPGIALQNFDINRKLLEQIGKGGFDPEPLPPSIQRNVPAPKTSEAPQDAPQATAYATPDAGGERLRPGQQGNLGTVTGVTVDGQPTEEPAQPFAARFAGAQVPDVIAQGPEAVAEAKPKQVQTVQYQRPSTDAGTQTEVSERNAARYETAANKAYQASNLAAAAGNQALAGSLKARGDAYMKQAEQIRGGSIKNQELTTGEKESRSGGSPNVQEQKRVEKYAEEDAKEFSKQQTSIQAAGTTAASTASKIQYAKQLTLDPNFYSGPWNETVKDFQQFRSIFGRDPKAASSMEAFNKLGQDMLQESIKSMGQSGVGRVLMSEVAIMKQAIAGLGITPASNRILLEMSARVAQKQQEIAQITAHLPPNTQVLNSTVQNYLKAKPLFTPQEVRNPMMLAAPDAPPGSGGWSPAQWQAWGQRVGVRPGEPVRYNGQYMMIPVQ